jgi:hypothetical protein
MESAGLAVKWVVLHRRRTLATRLAGGMTGTGIVVVTCQVDDQSTMAHLLAGRIERRAGLTSRGDHHGRGGRT